MKRGNIHRLLCLTLLALCLLLCACGKKGSAAAPAEATAAPLRFAAGEVAPTATEIRMPLAAGELALLDSLPDLRQADLSGSADEEGVAAWAKAHPGVNVRYTVTMPDGTALPSDTTSYDLSRASGADCEAAAKKLALLPDLAVVDLGTEDGRLTWANITAMRRSLPDAEFRYAFNLYGKAVNLSDTTISLFHVPVNDSGRLVDEVIGCMPQLKKVDMDGCGVEPRRLEEINLKHPNTQVIFRVFFGDNYTARTDTERILASQASRGGFVTPENYEGLFYCHNVKYLDLGHNTPLTDISFVAQMPELEVAILAMCNWSDASALAYCPKLEYLEIQNTYCKDLRPLSGLTNLRHLNIAHIGYDQPQDGTERIRLTDITPLYSLTGLERLWIGAFNPVPATQVLEMQQCAPNCEIDTQVYGDPTGGRWRYIELANYIDTYVDTNHPRYDKLREQFANYEYTAFNFTWNDPLLSEDAEAPDLNAPPDAYKGIVTTPAPTPAQQQSYVPEESYQEESYQEETYTGETQQQETYPEQTYPEQTEPEYTDPGEETYSQDIYGGDGDDGYGGDSDAPMWGDSQEEGDAGYGGESLDMDTSGSESFDMDTSGGEETGTVYFEEGTGDWPTDG